MFAAFAGDYKSFILSYVIPVGGSERPSNTWLSGPTRVLNPNGISIGLPQFAGLASVQTDRLTDHATRSVGIDRIYVYSTGDAV